MKVDSFDHTLVCESGDLQEALSYFKSYREIPIYVEETILRLILEKLGYKNKGNATIEELLNELPYDFVRNSISSVNLAFKTNKKVDYNDFYLYYLLYYLPANVFKIWKPLLELHIRNTLKPHMRILDIGTGPGSIPVGIIEFYKSLAKSYRDIDLSLSFFLVEKEEEFLDIATRMIKSMMENLPENLSINIEKTYNDIITKNYQNDELGKFDLITMSNFLAVNEENNQEYATDIIKGFRKNLVDDGSLIVIEPGDKANCTALKLARNKLVNDGEFTLYSPCIGIWEEKEYYNCSCFSTTRVYWKLPIIYKYLIRNGLKKGKRDYIPFNYVILRKDGLKKYETIKNTQYFTKISELWENIGEFVNVIALVRTFIIKGDSVYFSLCDGSCSFKDDDGAVWLYTSLQKLEKNGINVPIVSSEKIKLKKVLVKQKGQGIVLELGDDSTMVVEY